METLKTFDLEPKLHWDNTPFESSVHLLQAGGIALVLSCVTKTPGFQIFEVQLLPGGIHVIACYERQSRYIQVGDMKFVKLSPNYEREDPGVPLCDITDPPEPRSFDFNWRALNIRVVNKNVWLLTPVMFLLMKHEDETHDVPPKTIGFSPLIGKIYCATTSDRFHKEVLYNMNIPGVRLEDNALVVWQSPNYIKLYMNANRELITSMYRPPTLRECDDDFDRSNDLSIGVWAEVVTMDVLEHGHHAVSAIRMMYDPEGVLTNNGKIELTSNYVVQPSGDIAFLIENSLHVIRNPSHFAIPERANPLVGYNFDTRRLEVIDVITDEEPNVANLNIVDDEELELDSEEGERERRPQFVDRDEEDDENDELTSDAESNSSKWTTTTISTNSSHQ